MSDREAAINAMCELVTAVCNLAATGSYPADHYKRRLIEPVVDALLGPDPELESGDNK